MGNCKYCGKPAGFLRGKHAECESLRLELETRILTEIAKSIKSSDSYDVLEKAISEIEQSSPIPCQDRKALLIKGWENSVEQFLEDGILDATEEKRLMEFQKRFAISSIDLNRNGALEKAGKAAILREVLSGNLVDHLSDRGKVPINFQKGEIIVFACPSAQYLEDKTRRQYVGGSQGISIRLMKGLYYRVGAFQAQPVEHTERVLSDTGFVAVTNKNIYFAGSNKSVRIPYPKIVSFVPFSNGVGVMRDAANSKLQIFVTGDGWFIYNLVTNLAKL